MKKLFFSLAIFSMVAISFQVDTSINTTASFMPVGQKTLFYKRNKMMIA